MREAATPLVRVAVVEGDLFDAPVDVLVNAWNRNIIPWWLLIPGGVSGLLKRHAGVAPFRELARHGSMAVGDAVLTGGGRLEKPIIHVAGLNLRWRAHPDGIERCTRTAVELAWSHQFTSMAFPIIGAGHGGLDEARALDAMHRALAPWEALAADDDGHRLAVTIVRWRKHPG